MPDTKLSALTTTAGAATTALIYTVTGGNSYAITFDNVQKSITTAGAAATIVAVPGGIAVDSSKALYFGSSTADGSWRLVIDGANLSFQKRESGVWVEKASMVP